MDPVRFTLEGQNEGDPGTPMRCPVLTLRLPMRCPVLSYAGSVRCQVLSYAGSMRCPVLSYAIPGTEARVLVPADEWEEVGASRMRVVSTGQVLDPRL
eukprot:2514211-Rhodomonas_salina.2